MTIVDDSTPPDRENLTSKAYLEIRRRILENEMPAGHQVTEKDLAAILRMSRTPTREALIRLANEGLVEIRPRHGMRVRPVSPDDMREIYDILTALESAAAALAARRGLTPEQVQPLRQAVDDMDVALAEDDMSGWARADDLFHRRLVELSGNDRMVRLVSTFLAQSHRVRLMTLRMRPKPTRSNEDHRAVVEAITGGDAETARRVHREHRERNGEMLVDLLKHHGLAHL